MTTNRTIRFRSIWNKHVHYTLLIIHLICIYHIHIIYTNKTYNNTSAVVLLLYDP